MENYEEAIGIDVYKKTLDVSCYQVGEHRVFGNDIKGYPSMLAWVNQAAGNVRVIYCF